MPQNTEPNTKPTSFWDTTLGTITKVTGLLTAITALIVAVKALITEVKGKPEDKSVVIDPKPAVNDTLAKAKAMLQEIQDTPISDRAYVMNLKRLKTEVFPTLQYYSKNSIADSVNSISKQISVYTHIKSAKHAVDQYGTLLLSNYRIWAGGNVNYFAEEWLTIDVNNVKDFDFRSFEDSVKALRNILDTCVRALEGLPDNYFVCCTPDVAKEHVVAKLSLLRDLQKGKLEWLDYLKQRIVGSSEKELKIENSRAISNIKAHLLSTFAIEPNLNLGELLNYQKFISSEADSCIRSSVSAFSRQVSEK